MKTVSPGANQIRQVRLSEVGRLSKLYTRLAFHVLHRFHQRLYHNSITHSAFQNLLIYNVERGGLVSNPRFLLGPRYGCECETTKHCEQRVCMGYRTRTYLENHTAELHPFFPYM